jgi:hypothetical protein
VCVPVCVWACERLCPLDVRLFAAYDRYAILVTHLNQSEPTHHPARLPIHPYTTTTSNPPSATRKSKECHQKVSHEECGSVASTTEAESWQMLQHCH